MATATAIRPIPATRPAPAPEATTLTAVDPFTMVIFGATGDLAARKLLPALYGLWHGQFLPHDFAIVGVGRREQSDDAFRTAVREALRSFRPDAAAATDVDAFLGHMFYRTADFSAPTAMQALATSIPELEAKQDLPGNRLFYCATDPEYFGPLVDELTATRLVRRAVERPWTRVIIEKPFGHDLKSALALDRRLLNHVRPDQIYRIDHYLGKETVQNLLAFRFGNAIFEPLFSREYVNHVQITVAEAVGMENRRGAYYDHAGALRDVVQNHMLQLLALVAMDPPATLTAGDISDAKLKVLRSLAPPKPEDLDHSIVRGQYGPGSIDGHPVRGYRQEEGVAADSRTETYVALRTEISSWRWAGVPFLLRTGKRLPHRGTRIVVQFKLPPLRLFQTVECEGDLCCLSEPEPAVLDFRIQPGEGISLQFSAKRPGMQLNLEPVRFDFDYDKAFHRSLPEAYERLLLDAARGDATLFMRSDELDAEWRFVAPILDGWAAAPAPAFPNYAAGTWGPAEAERLGAGCLGGWRKP